MENNGKAITLTAAKKLLKMKYQRIGSLYPAIADATILLWQQYKCQQDTKIK